MKNFLTLAVMFRSAYFYAHHAHHMVKGETFMQDHEHLHSLYDAYLDAFDTLMERAVGSNMKGDAVYEVDVNKKAFDDYAKQADSEDWFSTLLEYETEIQSCISSLKGLSPGTQNLVQQLADDSEARSYKLKGRLG